jgi:phosphatidylinositol-3,4,5-trisphosphate 3-phosphatase/dual-specificity protein phosphatase PTEN
VKSRMDLGLEVGTACVDTSRAPDLIGGKNQGKFQNVITNAMSDMGNGILNAVDRIRISHLSVSGRLTSLPNSPRMIHGDRQDFGSARSTGENVANCEWLYGSSRSLSGRFLASSSFEDQTVKTAGKLEQLGIINVDQTGDGGDFSDHLCSHFKETPNSSFHSEDNGSVNYVDPPSDFQALAVASAADASVFSFVDDDDYESEDEVTVVST